MYNKLMGYLCRDGLESLEFGLSYLHLGTVPVLFVSFCLICHPYILYLFVFFCVMFGMYIYIENDISGIT